VQLLNYPHPRPSPKGRGETRDSLALWERAGVRETRDSLALWERAGVRVTNLDILILSINL